jgi:single-strand DNA-binding protein
MGRGLNKVMIIGYLGRDPELRYTPSGRPVASFSVATTRTWTSSEGERREETEWFNVVAWGNLAEICKTHLTKSQQVYVEGRLQTRGWEDENGTRHYRTELVASEMILLGDRKLQHEFDDTTETDNDDYPF